VDQLLQHTEALIFASDQPLSPDAIRACLAATFEVKIRLEDVEEALQALRTRYADPAFAFELVEIGGGFQFMTKPAYQNSIGTLLKQQSRKRLSRAALETLSIIAYKQPVPKSEIEKIRGVNCDYSLQKLLEKELVSIVGRSDGPGRPLLYGTSEKFMDYFGLKSLRDLPKPKDFKEPDSSIGEQAPIEEEVEAPVSPATPSDNAKDHDAEG